MSDKLLRNVALASCVEGDCNCRSVPGYQDLLLEECLTRARRSLEACHHAQLVEALEAARPLVQFVFARNPRAQSGAVLVQVDAALSLAKDGGK